MKTIVFLILTLLSSTLFWAQEAQPKIGLVLSGGGAKGFAHIGVLKEIDRAGIQLDYVGGTSMGAIIGGLYAAGYSGVQIEELVKQLDFESLLRDELPRSAAPFFDKEYAENTNVTLPVIDGRKIGIPEGVSKGQNVLNTFYELLGHVESVNDFSKLPIPFFCVATDAETGDPYLLESGSLPIALRASGSLPTLLNPVSYQGKLLVDGGVSNNFPVGIAKSKGMDIIIGVNVQSELLEKEKLTSIVKVLNQIVSYQMYRKSDEERKGVDIYIRPDILEYQVVDFTKKEELLKIGDAAAMEYRPVFEALAKKQGKSFEKSLAKVDSEKRYISKIRINGLSGYSRAYVLGKLKIREGDSLTRRRITEKINLLSATKNYDRIDYNFIKLPDHTYELVFNVLESPQNATVSLGAHYDLLYKSGILVNYKKKQLLTNNDQFSLDVILGDNFRYNLNYFVDNGFYISYGFRSRYNHFRDDVRFDLTALDNPNISNINLNFSDITNQLYFQTTFSRKFAIGIGAEHKYISATTRTLTVNDEATVLDQSSYFNTFGYMKLDTYDKKYFVTKGFYADLNFRWFMGSTDYNNNFSPFSQARGTLGVATTLFDRFTFQLTNEVGLTFNSPESNVFDYYLGGYNQNYINNFIPFYGLDFSDRSNDSFLKATANLRYRMGEKQYLSFIANYARLDDNVFRDIELFKNTISGYAVGYSLDTFIGPIELKYSWSPDSNQNFWLFNLGFWF